MADVLNPAKIKTTLTRKVGPAPVWVWVVVGVGVLYVYKRATSPKAPAEVEEVGYGEAEGYPAYAGYGGETYDAGSASYDGAGGMEFPESIPLTFEGGIPVTVAVDRPPRRHGRNPKVKKITKRIQALREGGVTKAERPKVQKLRERRKRLRGK